MFKGEGVDCPSRPLSAFSLQPGTEIRRNERPGAGEVTAGQRINKPARIAPAGQLKSPIPKGEGPGSPST